MRSASRQIEKDARDPNAGYMDASVIIGRAAEMVEVELHGTQV